MYSFIHNYVTYIRYVSVVQIKLVLGLLCLKE